MTDGDILAEGIAQTAIELQKRVGQRVDAATAVRAGSPGEFEIVCEYRDYPLGSFALKVAAPLVFHLLSPRNPARFGLRPDYNVALAIELFLSKAPRHGLDLTTAAIVKAAEDRNIPWFRVENSQGMVQLGHGRFAHRLRENLWDDESFISAGYIATDKALTNHILSSLGLPVTRQAVVMNPD